MHADPVCRPPVCRLPGFGQCAAGEAPEGRRDLSTEPGGDQSKSVILLLAMHDCPPLPVNGFGRSLHCPGRPKVERLLARILVCTLGGQFEKGRCGA
jgi:hypothetical protein